MNYLFGDSTPSELTSNFLEFFRDALDFSVFALQSDERIRDGKNRAQDLRNEADVEIERLERFITLVLAGVDQAEKEAGGKPDSPTAMCAPNLRESVGQAQRVSIDSIRDKLAGAIAQIEADEAAIRNACGVALATLLRPHDPPDANATTRIALSTTGAYEAARDARAAFGLDWTFELSIPDGNTWSAPLRVERMAPQLEIRAPQLTGFFSKEVKIKPQRIERFLITELVSDEKKTTLKVRAELGAEVGFDFKVKGESIKATRVGPQDDSSTGPFDVDESDAPKLLELVTKLRATTLELEQKELVFANAGDAPFSALPTFVPFVESFVAMMTPIVREIANRSLTPNELVIRRPLSNDRREEIFVPKATLREKFAALAPPLRAVFTPLGLDVPNASARPPSVRMKAEEPSVRAELPKSQPPPPLEPTPPPPPPTSKANVPASEAVERISSSNLKTIPLAPVSQPSPQSSAPPLPPSSSRPLPPPATPPVREPAGSSPEIVVTDDGNRNDTLVAALKKIALLSRNGRAEEAYREYAELFSSPPFGDYRPEDQRQALRLMVLAKSPPPITETVKEAHRVALVRIDALIKALEDPADYELLGVAKLVFDDAKAAGEAFSKALAIERAKNPQSELCGTLMKRVSAL